MRARPGLTALDTLLAVALVSAVAVPLATVAVRSGPTRSANQEELIAQQSLASVLTRFSQDVRSSSGLGDAGPSRFTLRQAAGGTFRYVTYQLTGGRLQRGESASAAGVPTSWEDLLDPALVRVSAGSFTYYAWANQSAESSKLFRRIAIAGFGLESARTGQKLNAPPISAVMREGANARSFILATAPEFRAHKEAAHGDTPGGKDNDQDAASGNPNRLDAMHVDLSLTNHSPHPARLAAFSGTWDEGGANALVSLGFKGGPKGGWGGGQAAYHSGGAPQALDGVVTLAPGQSFQLHLKYKMATSVRAIALRFYEAEDTARRDPFFLDIPAPTVAQK